MTPTRIALLHVGDELMNGRVVNSGGSVLASALTAAGFEIVSMDVLPDRIETMAAAMRRVAANADAVVVTGGLGPTPDDLTREALAQAAGVALVTDPGLLEGVVRMTRGRAREANEKQAAVPDGGVSFPNPVGVAAMLRIAIESRPVYALPGVPAEMNALLHQSLLPDLLAHFPEVEAAEQAVVRACGVAEAVLVERLGDLLARDREPDVGVTVADGMITITVRGVGAAAHAQRIGDVLGEDVCGVGEFGLAATVLTLLRERRARVAIAESLTGGLVADRLIAVPGASSAVVGAVVAYTEQVKHTLLDVPIEVIGTEGICSATVARAMARGVRDRLGAEYGVATTGAAGPDPEADGTPPGEGHVAVAGPDGHEEALFVRRAGDRDAIRRLFATAALDLLRRTLAQQ